MEKLIATAKGMSLPVSRKQCIEVCRFINRKDVETARKRLNRVMLLKMAVPSTKFKRDIPHRAGSVGPGRFPIKAARLILDVLNSAVANAEHKGMKASSLVIVKASACKGPTAWRYGRQSRRRAKRTHVEIVVEEAEVKKAKKEVKPKAELKPEAKLKSSERSEGRLGTEQSGVTKAEAKKDVKEEQKAPSGETK